MVTGLVALGLAAACGSPGGSLDAVAAGDVPNGTMRDGRPGGVLASPPAGGPAKEEGNDRRIAGTWRPQAAPGADDALNRTAVPPPVVLRIAAIGVLAPVLPLGLTDDRQLAVPDTEDVTGWWSGGSAPGRPGPTVIVGHVDSVKKAGVFEHLHDLRQGDAVDVLRDDGSAVTYVVERVEQYAKEKFPTRAVYERTARSTLRLITCGGEFDRRTRHYADNVIVFARLSGEPLATPRAAVA